VHELRHRRFTFIIIIIIITIIIIVIIIIIITIIIMMASPAWKRRKPRESHSFSAVRIAYTLKEVMWAGVFLLLIMYVFSLALTQGGTRLRLPGRLVDQFRCWLVL